MKLDTKTVRLSDGTELTIQWTWAAAMRLRKATGIDMMKAETTDTQSRAEALVDHLPVVLHSLLCTADREKYAPQDFEERIAFADMWPLIEQVFTAMHPEAEGKTEAVPFVNGVAGDPLASNTSTPSDVSTLN